MGIRLRAVCAAGTGKCRGQGKAVYKGLEGRRELLVLGTESSSLQGSKKLYRREQLLQHSGFILRALGGLAQG